MMIQDTQDVINNHPDFCDGPFSNNCEKCKFFVNCDHINYYTSIPNYIITNYMKIISNSSWKIFCYLNAIAEKRPDNKNFGMAWATYKNISNHTGVSANNMFRLIRELESHDLLTQHQHQIRERGNLVKTITRYEIYWYKFHKGNKENNN